ncbi:MAG: sigma-54 dependent transcriptional regulator, partial [Betaproteobacteria bacterium]
MTPRILIVDDDANLLKLLAMRLDKEGYLVTEASSAEQAIPLIEAVRPSMVITDMQMTGMDGMALFELVSRRYPNMPVIMLTAHGSIPAAVAATKRGMFGYLSKPFDARTLMAEVEKALASALPMLTMANDGVVTRSPQMQQVLADAQRIARNDAAALILGESGTGKELLARCIHQSSPRARGPFVALNCGAIPENLLESELFGHSKGAFTGAMRDYKGLIQQADGGTLFLDEIGDMPLSLQVKLLRVLQEKSFRSVGGSQELTVDMRVVSATHRDLEQAIKDGQFREDLFYRINVVELRLPPLRERREDIPLLVAHFLK